MSTTLTFSDAPDPSSVTFLGADGRERSYAVSQLPCPGLHADLTQAFVSVLDHVGTVITADVYFALMRRLLSFLDALGEPFEQLSELQPRHLDQYRASRAVTVSEEAWYRELSVLVRLLRNAPYGSLSPELGNEVLRHLLGHARPSPRVGRHLASMGPQRYSQGEFERLVGAARRDADRMAASGGPGLAIGDLAPLHVLAAALSGLRPGEIHDLPAAHTRAEDGRTVMVRAQLHRQPAERVLSWAVRGDESDWLSQMGDFYLMVHRLTEHARRMAEADRLWCVWTPRGPRTPARASLAPLAADWSAARRLADDVGAPLRVSLTRLRATVRLA